MFELGFGRKEGIMVDRYRWCDLKDLKACGCAWERRGKVREKERK